MDTLTDTQYAELVAVDDATDALRRAIRNLRTAADAATDLPADYRSAVVAKTRELRAILEAIEEVPVLA